MSHNLLVNLQKEQFYKKENKKNQKNRKISFENSKKMYNKLFTSVGFRLNQRVNEYYSMEITYLARLNLIEICKKKAKTDQSKPSLKLARKECKA